MPEQEPIQVDTDDSIIDKVFPIIYTEAELDGLEHPLIEGSGPSFDVEQLENDVTGSHGLNNIASSP